MNFFFKICIERGCLCLALSQLECDKILFVLMMSVMEVVKCCLITHLQRWFNTDCGTLVLVYHI